MEVTKTSLYFIALFASHLAYTLSYLASNSTTVALKVGVCFFICYLMTRAIYFVRCLWIGNVMVSKQNTLVMIYEAICESVFFSLICVEFPDLNRLHFMAYFTPLFFAAVLNFFAWNRTTHDEQEVGGNTRVVVKIFYYTQLGFLLFRLRHIIDWSISSILWPIYAL